MSPKVEVEHLSKVFTDKKSRLSTQALLDINLKVNAGELLCVVGPSGCGKTTLLRIIAGLEVPTGGFVYLDGRTVNAPGPERGLVFQEFALFPWRSVAQNVAFGPEILGVPGSRRQQIIDECLRLVRLTGSETKYPAELSGGMKQRVAIARALANNPGVLLMDEPFGSLDAQTRNLLQTELLRIWGETKKTIIFVTHNVDEAVYLADRIVLMTAHSGRIKDIFDITLKHPRDRTSEDFISYRREILGAFPQESENI
jgi:NitT/TauT family transport system ATP-binding protein